jgi:hypothetical protein
VLFNEKQNDLDLKNKGSSVDEPRNSGPEPPPLDGLGDQLTYSQEYYILHKEELVERRRLKEAEAKFGDYSARLVKRPLKNFLWGYGTQVHDENRTHGEE